MAELKPCPFCGGKPSIRCDEFGFYENLYMFTHTCKGRKPQLNSFSCGYATKQAAIEAWNTRYERTCTNIDMFESFKCSECGGYIMNYDSEYDISPDYCPDCGAKVVEE